jgi:hypothetical protein
MQCRDKKKHLLFSHQKLKQIHHNSIWDAKDESANKLDFYIFYLCAYLNARIELKVKYKFIECNQKYNKLEMFNNKIEIK